MAATNPTDPSPSPSDNDGDGRLAALEAAVEQVLRRLDLIERARPIEPLWNTAQVASRLGCCESSVRNLVAEGHLNPVRLGPGKLRFEPGDVERHIRRCASARPIPIVPLRRAV